MMTMNRILMVMASVVLLAFSNGCQTATRPSYRAGREAHILELGLEEVRFTSAPLGEKARFEVPISDGPAAYQWFKDGKALSGRNDRRLIIERVRPEDVGFYSCKVTGLPDSGKGGKNFGRVMFSRMVFLTAYSTLPDGTIGVIGAPGNTSPGSDGGCGNYAGYFVYCYGNTYPTWGWNVRSDQPIYQAKDHQSTNTCVTYLGKSLSLSDRGHGTGAVTVPKQSSGNLKSSQYRFGIFFPSGPLPDPSTYQLDVTGFVSP
jgi:hypothetical protein